MQALAVLLPLLAPAPQDGDLATRALAVLEQRCATCHGAGSEDKKAVRSWPDALDVPGAVEDAILDPGDAEASYLWELIVDGDMPPEDAVSGQLTEEERETLRAWIDGGAAVPPADAAPPGDPPGQEVVEPGTGAPIGNSVGDSAEDPVEPDEGFDWRELGRLHPMVVHFPIALLLAAVVAELLVGMGARGLRTTARFCAWLGAVGAGAAGALGWLAAEQAVNEPGLTETHRWLGVGTGVSALLLGLSLEARARSRGSRGLHVLLVVTTAVLVVLAGHWGGMLTWGQDYLEPLKGPLGP